MVLIKSILESGINSTQDPNSPPDTSSAAKLWSSFIFTYSMAGMAGVTIPQFPGYPSLLEQSFKASMDSNAFLEKLGTNLQTMWQSAIWSGPGFTGTTAVAIGSTLDGIMSVLGPAIANGENTVSDISTEIDTWTKTITVTLTNTSSGATSIVPVS